MEVTVKPNAAVRAAGTGAGRRGDDAGGGQTPAATTTSNVNITPPTQAPPVAAPSTTRVMPPARIITANTAAITGGVDRATLPVLPPPPAGLLPARRRARHVAHLGRARRAGLLVGGGYEDFTNSTLRNMTGGAGAWNARVIAGTRQYVGVEAAYVGAARGIDALGVQSNALLLSNGVEGALRLNVPVVMRPRQLLGAVRLRRASAGRTTR